MRKGIHPEYVESKFICSCGAVFTTRSTKPEVHLELCSQCHPFYTGKQKFVDTGGRVQRFSDRFGDAATAVLGREAEAKDARRKAAEEAAAKLKQDRDAKAAEKAQRSKKYEGTPLEKPERAEKAAAVEAVDDVELADEPIAEAIEETAEEPVLEAVEAADEPVADASEPEAEVAEDSPAEEPAE